MKKALTIIAIILVLGGTGYGLYLEIVNHPYFKSSSVKMTTNNNTKQKTTETKNNNQNSKEQNNTNNTSADNELDNIPENEALNETFNFAEASTKLHNIIKNKEGAAYIVRCETIGEIPKEGLPETKNEVVKVSEDTIDKLMWKLKRATSVKVATNSWFGCPPENISYYIANNNVNVIEDINKKYISVFYMTNGLAVGYDGVGYEFTYENPDIVKNFMENLE